MLSDMIGRALTKTFIHSPLVIFEPSAIPLCHIWSYENKFSRPYMTKMNERLSPLSKITSGKNKKNTRLQEDVKSKN